MKLFVHVTGSVPRKSGSDAVALTKRMAYKTERASLREKIGVVALAGGSPNEKTLSFDNEVIKAAVYRLKDMSEDGVLVRTVRHQVKWIDRVSDVARENLRLLAKRVCAKPTLDDEYTGGDIRNGQTELSDCAIAMGGYQGVVDDTARLLIESCPPKLADEIFVKGFARGLPADLRTRIDESRDWNSEADRRTAHKDDDCARVLARRRPASLLACESSRTPFG